MVGLVITGCYIEQDVPCVNACQVHNSGYRLIVICAFSPSREVMDFLNDNEYPQELRMSLLGRIQVERPDLFEKLQKQEKQYFQELQKQQQKQQAEQPANP